MASKIWIGTTGSLTTGSNWVGGSAPVAADDVTFPAGSGSITSNLTGLNTVALTGGLGIVIFEDGYTGTVGTSTAYMEITASRFEFSGSGKAYINLEASAIVPRIYKTGTPADGERGLYLKGSAMSSIDMLGGAVGIAVQNGETSTCTTPRTIGNNADLWLGAGVTTTTIQQQAGKTRVRCAATTITINGGELTTEAAGAVTTVNVRGGTIYPNSSGTVTTMNLDSGTANFVNSGTARTVTTLKQNFGSTLVYDPAVLTITNRSAPDYPIRLTATKP